MTGKKLHLTHWGRVMHICVSKLTIIGSDNGLLPDWRQAIIWTNSGLLLIGPLGTNFIEILIEILTFSFKKMRLKVSSAKRRPFCLGLNVLNTLMKTDHESLNLTTKCHRWNADPLVAQRQGFLSISDTKNAETISQIVLGHPPYKGPKLLILFPKHQEQFKSQSS